MQVRHNSAIFQFTGVLSLIIGFVNGQTVTLTGPSAVEQGRDTVFTCTGGSSPYIFTWTDISVVPNVLIFNGGGVAYPPDDTKYVNFEVSEDGAGTSTMTIMNTQIEDEGQYRCSEGQAMDEDDLTVEVQSTRSLSVASTLLNIIDMYEATCDAVGGRPNETITWMLGDSGSPCDDIVETYSLNGPDLFSKRSVCTFQADSENYGQTLRCLISGHQVSDLNGEETTTLNIHSAPAISGIMVVDFQSAEPDLRVSCDIADEDQPTPRIRNYYIYSNDALIHQSTTGVNFVVVAGSDYDLCTDFTCVAGNYLGNTTSHYNPLKPFTTGASTTKSKEVTTGSFITEDTTPETTEPSPDLCNCTGLCSGATAGIAVLTVLLVVSIIINVIQFIVWRRHGTRPDKNLSHKVTASEVKGVFNETNDNMAYEMIQSGDRAYTALKLDSSGASRSTTINPENMTFFTRLGSIGRGDFGAVWKGELRSNQGQAAVAIRQIPDHVSKSANLLQSVKVLCALSDQPNIVKCVGFSQEQSGIIYEFISGGTLLTHLQTTGVHSQPTYRNLKPNKVRVDGGSLLNFAWQIAKGMQFLASKQIVHGTLCAHNVLLAEKKRCKLSDYGLASSQLSNRGKPTRWSSPETMLTGLQSTEGDVWSYGIVLWEITTLGARPYPHMTFDTVQKEVPNGYKMPRPCHCGQELYAIMVRCWEKEGRNRTNFEEILNNLETLLEETHDYISLNDFDKNQYAAPLDV